MKKLFINIIACVAMISGYRFELILKELADPIGREIPELEKTNN